MEIQHIQISPSNYLEHTEYRILHNPEYLKKDNNFSSYFSVAMGSNFLFSAQVFRSKTKESVSFISCGMGIIIALSYNSSLSQKSIKHSSSDKGK